MPYAGQVSPTWCKPATRPSQSFSLRPLCLLRFVPGSLRRLNLPHTTMILPHACSHETQCLNHGLPFHQPGALRSHLRDAAPPSSSPLMDCSDTHSNPTNPNAQALIYCTFIHPYPAWRADSDGNCAQDLEPLDTFQFFITLTAGSSHPLRRHRTPGQPRDRPPESAPASRVRGSPRRASPE